HPHESNRIDTCPDYRQTTPLLIGRGAVVFLDAFLNRKKFPHETLRKEGRKGRRLRRSGGRSLERLPQMTRSARWFAILLGQQQ
ncbi:MAG: hypothetical protein ABR903_07070, partial [Thermodesulfovibrionales bacterium]